MRKKMAGRWTKGWAAVVVLFVLSLVAACHDGRGVAPMDGDRSSPADVKGPGPAETAPADPGDATQPNAGNLAPSDPEDAKQLDPEELAPADSGDTPLPEQQLVSEEAEEGNGGLPVNVPVELSWDNIRVKALFTEVLYYESAPSDTSPTAYIVLYKGSSVVGRVKYSDCLAAGDMSAEHCSTPREVSVVDSDSKVSDINRVRVVINNCTPNNQLAVSAQTIKIGTIDDSSEFSMLARTTQGFNFLVLTSNFESPLYGLYW